MLLRPDEFVRHLLQLGFQVLLASLLFLHQSQQQTVLLVLTRSEAVKVGVDLSNQHILPLVGLDSAEFDLVDGLVQLVGILGEAFEVTLLLTLEIESAIYANTLMRLSAVIDVAGRAVRMGNAGRLPRLHLLFRKHC